jgi:hypothetical protein
MQVIAAICFPVFRGDFSEVVFVSFMVFLVSYVITCNDAEPAAKTGLPDSE